jgi:hypothetical protein
VETRTKKTAGSDFRTPISPFPCLRLVALSCLLLAGARPAVAALDAPADGHWISIGVPANVHLSTVSGGFFLNGSDPGKCANVTPDYFRFDTTQPRWKEMYALILYSAAQGKALECVVASGCGSNEIWTSYCRTSL